jgi:hypothetical protein
MASDKKRQVFMTRFLREPDGDSLCGMRVRTVCLILAAWACTALPIAQDSAAYERGLKLYNQAKYSEALEAFGQAITENP